MAIELNLVKSDNDSWGFRVTGGAEYGVPLTVVKVTEDSIAEKSGLKCRDIIARVNNVATSDLTHSETHDLIISAGNNLILVVERPFIELNSSELCDEETNAEVCNIMESSLQDEQHFQHTQEQFEVIDPPSDYQDLEELPVVESETKPDQNHDIHQNENISPQNQRKWSTFLQKPSNPKPADKKKDVTVKGDPYRVIIKKQTKKASSDLENTNHEQQEENKEKCGDITRESNIQATEEQITFHAEIRDVEEITVENENCDEENTQREEADPGTLSKNTYPLDEKNSVIEKVLEEKLAEVQKQLEALYKLPLTIQSTIDAVTKQIASIVSASGESHEESVKKVPSEISSENDIAEQVITEESDELSYEMEHEQQQCEKNAGEDEQELDTGEVCETEENSNSEKNILEGNELENQVQEIDPDEGLTEEEKEAKRIEQEIKEKQQKEYEQLEEFKQRRLKQKPTLPLKPIERPIILPGGRRWSQPDDACPTVRNPKMTHEKIANTIETYSEVIIGKTKGESNCRMVPSLVTSTKNINFLKYQPPPKKLDYLQRSDVYKMVHDLEPPVRGISSRASKILSEQDYYQTG